MENPALAQKYGVMAVPTLVTDPADTSSAISGVSRIMDWANSNRMRA